MKHYRAGIDIGSTTVKLVILDNNDKIIYGEYRRHLANTQETLAQLLKDASARLGECKLCIKITGSGSINLAKELGVDFIQEVVAVATALQHEAPQTDIAIELGGEDAKIIYFSGGLDERMNGVCAGGTGSFIDQMALLLQTDAQGLNMAAEKHNEIYPIAARCGVFAKSDIQPLINQGASKADLAASIFQAVVNQTVSGLACGKPIRGTVAFLGGPLHFLPELKKAFVRTLKLTPETTIDPENSHLFAALGAALEVKSENSVSIISLIGKLEQGVHITSEMPRLEPLFKNTDEYSDFCEMHSKSDLLRGNLSSYNGECFLGIDAGSTTTKLALIGNHGELLYSYYSSNNGNPVNSAIEAMNNLKEKMPDTAHIVRSCSTGYGEELLKSAFSLDEGIVETIAHTSAAKFFECDVDCVLDIGGQDMKYIRLKDGNVNSVVLNEACSSGCGSFLENFASSLGLSVEEFSRKALFADSPVDLGTRCTVFMNSNVKQAQKEGASVANISAGLSYSVIKNALYKVIKITNGTELGKKIVVQGGTFQNPAVLRAFEKIAGVTAICPKISGIMGAFGAALTARQHYEKQPSTTLSFEEIANLKYDTTTTHCNGCSNNCMLTVNRFFENKIYISGNRCEKGLGSANEINKSANMVEYKRIRIFDYKPLPDKKAYRGTIGIPRVLNIYENYPFWATFFKELGFKVVLSPYSSRKIYELGMESIPSESECYPAKLSHGHVQWLIDNGVTTIFHPCVFYERKETAGAQNNFNCPIVISYPENLKNNIEAITDGKVHYIRPFISFADKKSASNRLVKLCKKEWGICKKEVQKATEKAWSEQIQAKKDIQNEGSRLLKQMRVEDKHGIVLVGRPYHIDPEINHGIPEMIASYGFTVFTEDSLPIDYSLEHSLRVVDQWVYHSRLYSAAEFVSKCNDLDIVQLNSFGCGLDAVTTDQISEILETNKKLYTVLKIDEVNNLGAVRIRIRSLIAAIMMRKKQGIFSKQKSFKYHRDEFTDKMFLEGYTILSPQLSPVHFELLKPVFGKYGYNIVVLDNYSRTAIDTGLKYVNNDACFPSITVVGQIMEAILSGKYNTDKLAIIMTQTGGCCRASNYIGFVRRALDKCGLSHIPVISVNANGMEKNSGFHPSPRIVLDAAHAIILGDLLMKCLYRVRPYEIVPDSANALQKKWLKVCIDYLKNNSGYRRFGTICTNIVNDFDNLPINETIIKPRVGVVGEILVKYMPLANNRIVELLEKEGAEAIVPDLMGFIEYTFYDGKYKAEYLGKKKSSAFISGVIIKVIEKIKKPATEALQKSRHFEPSMPINKLAKLTKPFLSIGNQYGEGWFLTGEMIELIKSDINNIICIQPFACLPNHVVGKGVIKKLKSHYPQANIAAVDYDPGASEVNQLNRIKLMLSAANKKTKSKEEIPHIDEKKNVTTEKSGNFVSV